MKLNRTLRIKIGKLSKTKQRYLDDLLANNLKAINFSLGRAREGKDISHKDVYHDLRKFNLPSPVASSCQRKAITIYKTYKKQRNKKRFPLARRSSVGYNNQLVKLRKTNNTLYKYFVSLLYKAGRSGRSDNRIELPLLLNSEYQTQIIQEIGKTLKLGSTEMLKRDNEYYIHVSYNKEVDVPTPNESFSPVGVDIGINNLAVSVAPSSVEFHSGQRVIWKNEFYRKRRGTLQQNQASQELMRLRGRQTKYNDFHVQNIAKKIIQQAKKENKPVIVMEELTNIREEKAPKKRHNYQRHTWVFRKLQNMIENKALWDSIPVVYVDPRYSSQICSKCGKLNKRNKHTYRCKVCGFECNADYNAGRNLQKFFLAKCQRERAPTDSASNIAIPEPKAKKGSLVGNISHVGVIP